MRTKQFFTERREDFANQERKLRQLHPIHWRPRLQRLTSPKKKQIKLNSKVPIEN